MSVISIADLPPEALRALGLPVPAQLPVKLEEQPPSPVSVQDAEPQPPTDDEKVLNPWLQFCSRVEKQVRTLEGKLNAGKGEKARVGDVKKFASMLKSKKAYDAWTENEILLEFLAWQKESAATPEPKKADVSADVKEKKTPAESKKVKAEKEVPSVEPVVEVKKKAKKEEPIVEKKGEEVSDAKPKKKVKKEEPVVETKAAAESESKPSKSKKGETSVEVKPTEIPVTEPPKKVKKADDAKKEVKKADDAKKGKKSDVQCVEPPKEVKKTKESNEVKEAPAVQTETPKDVEPTGEEKEPLYLRRKKIPKHIKTLVWNKYIGGDKAESKCVSCRQERIDNRNFHCGHVIAEAKGGDMTINNLRPICAACNLSMGTRSMNEFTSEFFGWSV